MSASRAQSVLIVVADAQFEAELLTELGDAGLHPTASQPEDAELRIRDDRVDLVVLDVELPPDCVRALATVTAESGSVLLLRAPAFDEERARLAMHLGARDLLTATPRDAAERVAQALDFSLTPPDVEHELQRLRSQHAALERRFLEQVLAFEETQETFYLDLARMMTIISNIMDGIVFADSDANITLMNPVAEDLLGIKSFMALGRTIDEIPGGGDLLEAIREDFKSIGSRRDVSRTVEVHHSEQDLLYIKVHTSRVADYHDASAGVLCVMQDVTAEYKTDQLKNQYLSIVAHELRTPLTGIKTFSTMMTKGTLGDLSEQQQRVMESIREQSLRLEHQIDKLINLGHLESDDQYGQDLEVFGVHDLVSHSVAPFEQAAANRDIGLDIEFIGEDCIVEGDRADLRRAIQAVVENAVKFTADGGSVAVTVDSSAGDHVGISIRDDGAGIDPRYHRRIFEKFFQVEDPLTRHHGGAGLGLFFARGIVRAHGSQIQVTSELGAGATFAFELQIAEEASEEALAETGSAAPAPEPTH